MIYAVIDTNVTGNLKHYPIDPRVVTPAQMLEILEKD